MARPPDKPNFLVLGAAKSGTTSLCAALARHPDVWFSEPKEPVFFEREYPRGLDYYWNEYFQGWNGEPLVGEGRVYHLYLPFIAERIRASLPDALLVALLRDPAKRAHSHWWHRVTRGYERRSFEEVVQEELAEFEAGRVFETARDPEAWAANFYPGTRGTHADVREVRYLEIGRYADQIRRYLRLFPRERFRLLVFEELVRDPADGLHSLYEFLDADPTRAESSLPLQNVGLSERKRRAAFLLERTVWRLRLDRLVPKGVRTAVRRGLSREAERPPLGDVVQRRLRAHFAVPNRELEELTGRRLGAWAA